MSNVSKKFIDITPHRSILTKISQTGYSVQEALSELVDNAIDARQIGKKLTVKINISSGSITIEDNGIGMNEKDACKSIRLGFSSKKDQLGEFGLGLKTASSFLGKHLELRTTQNNSDEEYIIEYDEDIWLKRGDWHKFPFNIINKDDKGRSGTRVKISQLKTELSPKLVETIIDEFSVRFGPFIENKELELFFNKKQCHSLTKSNIIGNKITKFEFKVGSVHAKGWWGYQLAGFNKSYYGLNTFRRGRLVTTYDKLGITPNQDIKQIIGDLHIDGIPITHDKKGWLQSSKEYKELEKILRKYFKPFEKKPKKLLSGYPVSGGKIIGKVRLINMFMSGDTEKEMSRIKKGDIIVTAMTRPHFLLGIRRAGGIITDLGGTLCHAAIVSREFNISAVVGTQIATSILKDNQEIILDGDSGIIYEY